MNLNIYLRTSCFRYNYHVYLPKRDRPNMSKGTQKRHFLSGCNMRGLKLRVCACVCARVRACALSLLLWLFV